MTSAPRSISLPLSLPHSRRRIAGAAFLCCLAFCAPVIAASAGQDEAVKALKEALTRGATQAVASLGKPGGFLGNERVRLALPEKVQEAEKLLRRFGGGKYADQLIETMNRAAETAVVEAKPVLWQAVRQMSVQDALGVLKGGDDAATQYFRGNTTATLTGKLRPLVEAATQQVGVAKKYDKFAGKALQLGLIDAADADLDGYITAKALDGLFVMMAEEEKAIRKDPVATGSAIIRKVFGSLLN